MTLPVIPHFSPHFFGKKFQNPHFFRGKCGGSTEKELLNRVSEQCGTTNITSDGSERPLITPAELMALEKTWNYKECIYLNLSESIRYCTKLPCIEAYDLGNYPPPSYKTNHPQVKAYSVSKLLFDISRGKAHLPFSEPPKKEDEKGMSQKRNKKQKNNYEENDFAMNSETEELQKELERKFDELFGSFSSNDE